MRIVSFVLGGLLLIAGAGLVVIADQQREHEVAQARAQLEAAHARLDAAEQVNLALAEELVRVRGTIADHEDELADTAGFLK